MRVIFALMGYLCLSSQANIIGDLGKVNASAGVIGESNTKTLGELVQYSKSLIQSCDEKNYNIQFENKQRELQAYRHVLSNLQGMIFPKLIKELGRFAGKALDQDRWEHLTGKMVKNWCSPNFTLYSKRYLKRLMDEAFEQDWSLEWEIGPAQPMKSKITGDMYSKRALSTLFGLFQSLCSWGGDPESPRLLTHFIRSPIMYSKLIEVMQSSREPVVCQNLLCRYSNRVKLRKNFPLPQGQVKYEDYLGGLYCEHFRSLNEQNSPKLITNWIDERASDAADAQLSYAIALLKDIPFLDAVGESPYSLVGILNQVLVIHPNEWAKKRIASLAKQHWWEDSLIVEVRETRPVRWYQGGLRVDTMVTNGALDRSLAPGIGTVDVHFNLSIARDVLLWARKTYDSAMKENKKEKITEVYERVAEQLKQKLESNRRRFFIAPWDKDLEGPIAVELVDQLKDKVIYERLQKERGGKVTVSLHLHFAPYALQYMYYRYQRKTFEWEPSYLAGQSWNRPQ